MSQLVGVLERFAESEIGYFEVALVNEDVVRLDIPMHDVVAGQDLEGLNYLAEVHECLFL